MNFDLSPQQLATKDAIRKFCDEKLAPIAREQDTARRYPKDIVLELGRLGFLCPIVPKEWGGGGLTSVESVIIAEELARASAGTATMVGAHYAAAVMTLLLFGTEEQKDKYLRHLSRGEMMGAFALTERGAGSDAGGVMTLAQDQGDHWLINGRKQWITNGNYADFYTVFCRTSDQGPRGISAIIVPWGTEGFTRGDLEPTLGVQGSQQCELYFHDVKVPKENVLGGTRMTNKGFIVGMKALDVGRIGVAAAAVGIGQAAFEASAAYAKTRKQFGQTLAEFQGIQWWLADMYTELHAARLMTFCAAAQADKGEPFTIEASMAKLYASEAACRACDKALQIHGGYGYTKNWPVERFYRDVRIKRIYEGTTEIQRRIISREVVKKFGDYYEKYWWHGPAEDRKRGLSEISGFGTHISDDQLHQYEEMLQEFGL